MNWYYVEAGQQAGPVDDAQLEALVRSGRIQPDTLVWHEGLSNWVAYQQMAPAPAPGAPPSVPLLGASLGTSASPSAATPPVGVICSECGRAFSTDEVIRYGDRYICAACKPVFFQRLQEGAALAGTAIPGTATEADLLARDYEVDIGSSFSRGFEVFKANMGIMIGASILVYLAMMATNWVPYLGIILALILTGPLMGGLWVFYIKKIRNEDAGVGDAFSGFGPRFWQLALTQLIPGLITMGFMLLFGVVFALMLPALAGSRRALGSNSAAHFAGLLVPMAIVLVLFGLAMTYLTTCWMFALPLAADKGLKFWPALELSRKVVSKHWWMTFWLLVVCGFLGAVGLIACLVGMLFTGPVAFATIVAHYEKVFGDLAPSPT
jgi:hypothetical protein